MSIRLEQIAGWICGEGDADLDESIREALADPGSDVANLFRHLRGHDGVGVSENTGDFRGAVILDVPPSAPSPSRTRPRRILPGSLLAAAASLLVALIGFGLYHTAKEKRLEEDRLIDGYIAASLEEAEPSLGKIDRNSPRFRNRMQVLFAGADPSNKLKGALALASISRDASSYAFERLMNAKAAEIGPVARTLILGRPGLREELSRIAVRSSAGTPPNTDAADRRRANAAVAGLLLGRPDAASMLLKGPSSVEYDSWAANSRLRTYVVNVLGESGISPLVLLGLILKADEPMIRMALVLALGQIPDTEWSAEAFALAVRELGRLRREERLVEVIAAIDRALNFWGFADQESIVYGRPSPNRLLDEMKIWNQEADYIHSLRPMQNATRSLPIDVLLDFRLDRIPITIQRFPGINTDQLNARPAFNSDRLR